MRSSTDRGLATCPGRRTSFPGLLGNVVAGRIANRLDLGGTNCVVDAACASSLSAVHLAMLELCDRPARCRADRRRRHVQRHLHVHVLQQDPGPVADRRREAVRRRRRRHHPGRGARHRRAEAAGRRRARRRPHLCGDQGHRRRPATARATRSTPRRARPGAGACGSAYGRPASRRTRSNWSRRTAPARRSATRPKCAALTEMFSAPRQPKRDRGARSARSSRRSATRRPRRGRRG